MTCGSLVCKMRGQTEAPVKMSNRVQIELWDACNVQTQIASANPFPFNNGKSERCT